MAEVDMSEAPVEEQQPEAPPEEAPAQSQPEVQPEAQPIEEPAPASEQVPVEQPSFLDLLIGKIETRLTNLEAESHGRQHNLDESAIKQIASLVLASINESIRKHLE